MGFLDPRSSECGNPDCIPCYGEKGIYRMAKSTRESKPSGRRAVDDKAALMPEEERTIPHITDYPDLVDILPALAEEHRALSDQIAPLEDRKRELAEEIKALLDAVEVKSIRGAGWVATRSADGFTESLKKEKLLEAGVTMAQIEAGIVRSPRKGYVQVKKAED